MCRNTPFLLNKNDYKGMNREINCTGSDTIKAFVDADLKYYNSTLTEASWGK